MTPDVLFVLPGKMLDHKGRRGEIGPYPRGVGTPAGCVIIGVR
jgi:hypothetical protein